MDLHLTTSPNERDPHLRLFVNDVLACELAVGQCQDRDTLGAEVHRARVLEALARFVQQWQEDLQQTAHSPDDVNKTPAARQMAFAKGLEAGLRGDTMPFPSRADLPPLPPEHSPSYRRGYEHGEALARASALLREARGSQKEILYE